MKCQAKTVNGRCDKPVDSKPDPTSPTKWYGRKVKDNGEVTTTGTAYHSRRIYGNYCYYHQKIEDGLI